MKSAFFPAALCLALATGAASARDAGSALDGCVELGSGHSIVRQNDQQFFLKNGEQHYRVALSGACNGLSIASRIQISSDGEENRLCPTGSKIKTNRDTCRIGEVTLVDADEFARRARMRR